MLQLGRLRRTILLALHMASMVASMTLSQNARNACTCVAMYSQRPSAFRRHACPSLILSHAGTTTTTTMAAPNQMAGSAQDMPSPRARHAAISMRSMRSFGDRGVVLFLAYATISAIWYSVGMVVVLTGRTALNSSGAAQPSGRVARVIRRLAVAWALTFSASQLTTPWRAAGAVALSPAVERIIRGPRQKLRAAVYFAVLALAFGSGLLALGLRELYHLI